MQELRCLCCGEPLVPEKGLFRCKYCGMIFTESDRCGNADSLKELLSEERMEAFYRYKRILYDVTHAKYPSEEAVLAAARQLLSVDDSDALANVYVYSHDRDPYRLNSYLTGLAVSNAEAEEIVRWLLPSFQARTGGPLKSFVERHFKNEALTRHITELEDAIAKIDEGVYEAGLLRDVFVAYSSADMPKVVHIIDLLEENGLACFAAFRNLRHGKGAAENYLSLLQQAMSSCRMFLFLSSPASLSATCDAVRVELPYLISNLPQKPRIQFILEDPERIPFIVNKTLKAAFPSQEWCRDKEDLIERIYSLLEGNGKTLVQAPSLFVNDVEAEKEAGLKFSLGKTSPKSVGKKTTNSSTSLFKQDGKEQMSGSGFGASSAFTIVKKTLKKYDKERRDSNIEIPHGVLKISASAFKGATNLISVTIPSSVTEIAQHAFDGCSLLESVTIPSSIIKIGSHAFYNCSSLKSIVIPSSVTKIEDCTFGFCSSLESVTIPPSVNEIGTLAFEGCSSLPSVTIPSSVVKIGFDSFKGCNSLEFHKDFGANYLGNSENPLFGLISLDKKVVRFQIPRECKVLARGCFEGCSSLESIVIPSSVNEIGESLFSDCSSLKSLVLPSSITKIGCWAFSGCSSLESIVIPSSVNEIGAFAFKGCSSLDSLVLPSSVTSIGDFAFIDCGRIVLNFEGSDDDGCRPLLLGFKWGEGSDADVIEVKWNYEKRR